MSALPAHVDSTRSISKRCLLKFSEEYHDGGGYTAAAILYLHTIQYTLYSSARKVHHSRELGCIIRAPPREERWMCAHAYIYIYASRVRVE